MEKEKETFFYLFEIASGVCVWMVRKKLVGGEEEEKRKGMSLGKYQLGRILGEGNFGKVKLAKNLDSGQSFAVKILEKNRIIDLKITDQVFFFFF